MQAVRDNNEKAVEEWLKCRKKRVRYRDKHGYAPVHYAAKFNHVEILEKLHKEGNAGKLIQEYRVSIGTIIVH